MYPDEYLNQAQTGAQCEGQRTTPLGVTLGNSPYNSPSLAEQADKNASYHTDEANKSYQAGAFLRNNPAFDEFIQLVRKGAIQF